ncbi:hypothetical protein N878_04350 [Pseudomonas sp. EGD-AK9]|nr:hypothetical protein [Pseudomonas sp. EGD-AK9]ERI52962.1 hypothetical protein N878_04350 [Pseudomonas sp. EGD-AK9]
MSQLKVAEALSGADDERGIPSRELHRQLSKAGEPLPLAQCPRSTSAA